MFEWNVEWWFNKIINTVNKYIKYIKTVYFNVRYVFVLLIYCMYLCTVELHGQNLFHVHYWVHSSVLQCRSLHFTNAITHTERLKPFVNGYFSWRFPNELHSQTVDYDTQYQGTHSALRTWNGIFQNCGVSVADGRNSKFMQDRSALFSDITWRIRFILTNYYLLSGVNFA